MKIAVVHSFYSGSIPSGENTVVNMQVEALRQFGHDVSLVSVSTDELSRRRGYSARAAWNVVGGGGESPLPALQRLSPDVVHVHNLFPNYSTRWLSGWKGALVSTVHNYRPVCAAGTLFRNGKTCVQCPENGQVHAVINACYRDSRLASIPLAVRNRNGVNSDSLLRRSDRVIFLSERSRRQYEDFGFSSLSHVVPNFVETSPQKKSGSDRRWAFVGRLSYEKGILPLLEAWPKDVGLDIYGDGPLQERVRQLQSTQIRWHGSVPRQNLLELLPNKDGLVIPSVCAEQFPTVYPEALAAGLPVVAKSGNSAADDIVASGAGAVFNEWNEVASTINAVSQDRHRLASRATEHFSECFTKERWINSIGKVYEGALTNANS